MVWKAAILGAGRIGSQLDSPAGTTRLTHAGGYHGHPSFTLAALADPDPDVARREAGRWGAAAYTDARQLLEEVRPEVVSVCAPTELHAGLIELALAQGARAVVCEKPLAGDLEDARRVAALAREGGAVFLVNYTRRFVPFYRELREELLTGRCQAVSATIKYAKGIAHNGSHALDLARFLFGEPLRAQALSRRHDLWPDDPTVSAFLRLERCPDLFLQGHDEGNYTFFEFDLMTRQGRLVVNEDGFAVTRYRVREHPDHRCMSLGQADRQDTGHARAALELMGNLARALDGQEEPWCTASDALRAQELAHDLTRQACGE